MVELSPLRRKGGASAGPEAMPHPHVHIQSAHVSNSLSSEALREASVLPKQEALLAVEDVLMAVFRVLLAAFADGIRLNDCGPRNLAWLAPDVKMLDFDACEGLAGRLVRNMTLSQKGTIFRWEMFVCAAHA